MSISVDVKCSIQEKSVTNIKVASLGRLEMTHISVLTI